MLPKLTSPRMRGPEVLDWQNKLLILKYDLGQYGADGVFGPATDQATRAFQTTANITVDGTVGPVTQAAADKAIADQKPPYSGVMRLVSLRDVLPVGQTTMMGFDASCYVWPEAAKAMWNKGYRIVFRYLRLWDRCVLDRPDGQGGSDSLSKQERDELLSMGYLIGLVSFATLRSERYPLTAEGGTNRGDIAGWNATELGFPQGMHLHSDQEYSSVPPGSKTALPAYENARFDVIRDRYSMVSSLYVGTNLGMTGKELCSNIVTPNFWRCAVVDTPTPSPRGVKIQQGFPKTITVGGRKFEYDPDVVQADLLGDYPVFGSA
jgi:hypothetical protein